MRQRPTLPHSLPCSTIGAGGLNGRVRNGNGCGPSAIATAISCSLPREWQRYVFDFPSGTETRRYKDPVGHPVTTCIRLFVAHGDATLHPFPPPQTPLTGKGIHFSSLAGKTGHSEQSRSPRSEMSPIHTPHQAYQKQLQKGISQQNISIVGHGNPNIVAHADATLQSVSSFNIAV